MHLCYFLYSYLLFVCLDSNGTIDTLEVKAESPSQNTSKRPIPISTQVMKKEFAAKVRRIHSNHVSFSM